MKEDTDLAALAHAIVIADDDAPMETFVRYLNALDYMKRTVREAEAMLKEKAVEWCRRNNRDIEVGEGIRYYAGVESETKCVDVAGALMALLETVGGDFGKLVEFLASQPIKPGASRGALDADTFKRCFETVQKWKLREGKRTKVLIRADERFAK